MNSKSRVSRTSNRIFLCGVLSTSLTLLACGGGGGGDDGGGGGSGGGGRNFCAATPTNQTLTGTLPGGGAGARFSSGGTLPTKAASFSIDVAGNYSYTPKSGVRGMDKFSYLVTNGNGTSEGVVTVLIDGSVRVMPLGDSITTGVSEGSPTNIPPEQQVGYRRKLFNDLEALSGGYTVNFVGSLNSQGGLANPPLADRDHEGHPGWCDGNRGPGTGRSCTIPGAQAIDVNIRAFLDNNPADLILLHIGTNDLTPNDPSGVAKILDNISSWAQTPSNYPVKVFLARIIPSTNGSLDVETFNNNVQAIANSPRPGIEVRIVDQQAELRQPGAGPNFANPALMAMGADTLHPNQTGYDRMANRWKNDIVASGVLPSCE